MLCRAVVHQEPPVNEPYYTNHTSDMVNCWPVKPVYKKTTERIGESSPYRTS